MVVSVEKLKLGIVGPGIIWEKTHKPVLKKLNDLFEIAAFCASGEKSREKVTKEYPEIPFYNDYKKLAVSQDIDTVVVLTPIKLNAKVSMAALDAGKDVISEKPVASSSLEARQLIKKEKSSGKKVIILEQFVYQKSTTIRKKIITSGKIGDLLFYDKLSHFILERSEDNELNFGNTGWRINPEHFLGIFFDSCIHDLAEFSVLFGDPISVYATGTNYRKAYGEEDHIAALFEYSGKFKGFLAFHPFLAAVGIILT